MNATHKNLQTNSTVQPRWKAERTAPPDTSPSQAPALQASHAQALVDVFTALVEEYPPAPSWSAELYAAVVGGTPALSDAPCPDLKASHAKVHLHLVACEVGRLLSLYPGAVLAGLVEGLTQPTT